MAKRKTIEKDELKDMMLREALDIISGAITLDTVKSLAIKRVIKTSVLSEEDVNRLNKFVIELNIK